MSHYLWLIDEGHGGLENGVYTTPAEKGKQYTFEEDDLTIYEGKVNRNIGFKLKEKLTKENIDFASINDPVKDTSLKDRVTFIDKLYHEERQRGKTAILLSIHSNAMTKPEEIKGQGQTIASYNSVWTSRGQTKSDKVSEFFYRAYEEEIPEKRVAKDRSDGDNDFEADFYILRKSDGPAVLVESLFFDNRKDAEFLLSEDGQAKIASALFKGILDCENIKPI